MLSFPSNEGKQFNTFAELHYSAVSMTMATVRIICLFLSLFHASSARPFTSSRWSPIEGNFFEGDIMLRNGTSPYNRNAMRNKSARWPEGIVYYVLDSSYDDDDREVIREAIEEFEKQTCIRWVERTDEENFVEIENDMGCWSELGSEGGAQSLSLESPICMSKGVVMHEMMHTLGFLHEMSRPDRDQFIFIHWNNIIPGMEANFQKMNQLELDDLGLAYDYRSVMHYRAWAFAKDRSFPTASPKESEVHLNDLGSGQTKGEFSELDVQKIKLFYECDAF